jgi:hypothetical protein
MAGTVVFSDGFDGDAPTGWHANNATVSTDTTHVLTGTRALRVATPGAAGDEGVDRSIAHPISGASDLISVGPNSTYQLSVWLYGNGNLGTRILLDSHDEDFIHLGSQGELQELRPPAAWTNYDYTIVTPPTARWLNIRFLTLAPHGYTYWVDALVLTLIQEEAATWVTPHTYEPRDVLTAPVMNRYERRQLDYLYNRPLLVNGGLSLALPFEQRAFKTWTDTAYIDLPAGLWLIMTSYAISTPDEPGGAGQQGDGQIRLLDSGGAGELIRMQAYWFRDYASSIYVLYRFTAANTRVNTQIRFDSGGQAPWPNINRCELRALRVALP